MRILLASDHYPPFIGGAQRQTHVIAEKLHERGHQVSVATVWQDHLPDFEDIGGIRIHRLKQLRSALPGLRGPARRRHQPAFPDPVTIHALRAIVDDFHPGIIHAAGWFALSAAAVVRRRSVPLLISARDYGFSCPKTTLLHEGSACSGPGVAKCLSCASEHFGAMKGSIATAGVLGSRPLLRRQATGLHSVSHYVEDVMERDFLKGSPAVHKEVIPSFLVEDAPGDASELAFLPEEPFIMFVGALRLVKGIDVLLDAYAGLSSPPPLVLVGTVEADTPPMPEGVVLLDSLPHWAVLAAWERSLFGVMPSRWPEPFGSTVHEAMSRGRTVIGTYPGGHADMIDQNLTGILVPAGDVGALRGAMATLIEDADLRRRLGERAAARAAEFSADAVVPRFEALYERLIAQHAHRSA